MKIPAWFVIGCGLLVLNLVIVLGGALSRHASAEPPNKSQETNEQEGDHFRNLEPPSISPSPQDPASLAPALPQQSSESLPVVPSLENATLNSPSIVSLEEVKNAVGELHPPADLLAPLDAMMKDSAAPVSEQLSHSFFESMKLRLKTVKHLNQSAAGLVDEAAILYQRGEVAEAQKLLGVATQLRETTARLLVTHQ